MERNVSQEYKPFKFNIYIYHQKLGNVEGCVELLLFYIFKTLSCICAFYVELFAKHT